MNYSTIGKALLLLPLLLLFSCNDQSERIKELEAQMARSQRLLTSSIEVSNYHIDMKRLDIMSDFEVQMKRDPQRVEKLYRDAVQASNMADQFGRYVMVLEDFLIEEAGGYSVPGDSTTKMLGENNRTVPTRILVADGKGYKLQIIIEKLKEELLGLRELNNRLWDHEMEQLSRQIALSTEYDQKAAKKSGKKDWVEYNFDGVSVITACTMLTKIRNDAKTSVATVLEILYKQLGRTSFRFDAVKAMAVSPDNHLVQGETFQASIYLAALCHTVQPRIYIGEFKDLSLVYAEDGNLLPIVWENPLREGYQSLEVVGGMANYQTIVKGAGSKTITGAIKVRKPGTDLYEYYPFEMGYIVTKQ